MYSFRTTFREFLIVLRGAHVVGVPVNLNAKSVGGQKNAGYAAQQKRIGPDLVGLAAREILGARRRLVRRRPWIRRSYVAGAALLLIASGVLAWQQWTRVAQRPPVASAVPAPEMPPVGAAAAPTRQPERVGETFAPPSLPVSKDAG